MRKFFILMLFLLTTGMAFAETFQSSTRHVTLMELYSSEGCSSCNPADDWVRGFRNAPGLWKDYVPAVFHVDYWDGAGWKDPFGSSHYTRRQEKYMQIWHGGTIFTPCVLVNGRVWANPQGGIPIANEHPGVLKVETQGPGRYRVVFDPTDRASKNYEAHIVLLGFDVESKVDKGENAGKTLKHDFIVLDYQHAPMAGSSSPSAALNLSTHDSRARKFGVAVWVTANNNPLPLQATGGYLS